MVWATIHKICDKICRKSSAGCLPMIADVDLVPNYFHFSFFPWHSILHGMTKNGSDHMWVGAARLGIQDALSYSDSHGKIKDTSHTVSHNKLNFSERETAASWTSAGIKVTLLVGVHIRFLSFTGHLWKGEDVSQWKIVQWKDQCLLQNQPLRDIIYCWGPLFLLKFCRGDNVTLSTSAKATPLKKLCERTSILKVWIWIAHHST